ncbi:STM4015 family protein [Clostridium tetani]|uniref:STM4015 family protein n=1 Tax=Clostridium tetani TaxID=1513 RepID=UPI0005130664|nr:STM4015 family protein [Clostridium tetani]KGI43254.1 hypothetical protein KY55_07360 [Clostridium tetani]RXI69695.1 hypothetical protein DP127_10275 [Clostridium tetani]BDR76717.1 WGR domain-containing protein [Clostridium tetani]BDR85070.1 WGR domain-containing protein [Clostridium tetani]BDR87829.1 WGR domain-containing protein [Clostridium tetani]
MNDISKESTKFFLEYEDEYEIDSLAEVIEEYLNKYSTYDHEELRIGCWIEAWDENNEADKIVKFIVENKDRFPNLKKIYFGDMDSEECEISWIFNGDLAPLINNFNLNSFTAQGGMNLRFKNLKSNTLKELIVISGGTSKETIEDIALAELPNLEKLEIYFGDSNYGFDAKIEDIQVFMNKSKYPKLKYLGLKNSEIQDEICEKLFQSDIVETLEVLDISFGVLSDKGAEVILNNLDKLSNLKEIDLTYNYISEDFLNKLEESFEKLNLKYSLDRDDVYDLDEDEEWRSPFISE